MKTFNKIASVILKIAEIVHWIATVAMAVAFVLSLMGAAGIKNVFDTLAAENETVLTTYGFEVAVTDNLGNINFTAVSLFAIGAVFILFAMSMVFRNAYLIVSKSQNASPFTKDNVRMVREIGIFVIAVPIIALIMSTVIRLAIGSDLIESHVRFDSISFGILALALSNIFACGLKLQTDNDGLI